MKYPLILLIAVIMPVVMHASIPDSLIVSPDPDGWNIHYQVGRGETIFSLARRYHVPPAILADANGKSYKDGLSAGMQINIPLGPYNMLAEAPFTRDEARILYYRVGEDDRLYRVSRGAGVSQATIMAWNHLGPSDMWTGRTLIVGWVKYDATPIVVAPVPKVSPVSTPIKVRVDTPKYVFRPVDTPIVVVVKPPASSLEQLWNEQTGDGKNVVTEKGTAGFFTTGAGANIYAFHNRAARGTIILVTNLNNNMKIYVKVLGPLPETKTFAGCVLGLSNAAKAELGIREQKAFCVMSYAGY